MSSLYPLKFTPIFKEKIWGGSKTKTLLNLDYSPLPNCGEVWAISGVKGNPSVVDNGFLAGNELNELIEIYMDELVGDSVYTKYGTEFPVLIKFIDANDYLSVQVHPDDKTAKSQHNSLGKTEMWYVLQAEKDAKLISGFNCEINKDEYTKHVKNKTLKEILNYESVSEGDVFFMPAGRVHALGPGIFIAEIQQTSDITYRIHDWDRTDEQGNSRELHTETATDSIDFKKYDNYKTAYKSINNESTNLAQCPYFTTNLLDFNKSIKKDYFRIDSFVIHICLSGQFEIKYNEGTMKVNKGETVLLPADINDIELIPNENTKILEVYIAEEKKD